MQTFTISQLSQFSGIKQPTIRIWEQRYGALSPLRTQGNTRYYDNNQLRRLLNIVSLQNSGGKISDLCALDDTSLYKLIETKLQSKKFSDKAELYITQLIAAGINYNEVKFNQLFTDVIKRYGIKESYLKVLHPLLDRLGLLWNCDNIIPPQEHFICNLLKQKFYTYIDQLPAIKKAAVDWVILLPENEFHEMGLLMAYILLKKEGKKVIYLGANIPVHSFIASINETGAKNVMLFTVHSGQENIIKQYATLFCEQTKNKQLYVAGNKTAFDDVKGIKAIKFLSSISDLEKIIK